MKRRILITLLALFIALSASTGITTNAQTDQQTQQTNQQQVIYKEVEPLTLIQNPANYLNKNIRIKATFDKFTNLGLDYKPAMRSSQNYISFLILRDDVGTNIIPLSEMKLFLSRKMAEKFIELETGDKISIEGKVFSNALSDCWIDVTKITIIQKKKTTKKA